MSLDYCDNTGNDILITLKNSSLQNILEDKCLIYKMSAI